MSYHCYCCNCSWPWDPISDSVLGSSANAAVCCCCRFCCSRSDWSKCSPSCPCLCYSNTWIRRSPCCTYLSILWKVKDLISILDDYLTFENSYLQTSRKATEIWWSPVWLIFYSFWRCVFLSTSEKIFFGSFFFASVGRKSVSLSVSLNGNYCVFLCSFILEVWFA